ASCCLNPITNPLICYTLIRFYVTQPEAVSLVLYNMQGRLVKTVLQAQHLTAGEHKYSITGSNLPSGMYLCVLTSPSQNLSQKVVKLK
ncbi:MAG TPA: T9SS type A sorting domain-containing protein, partial [Chitinophagales bacterium]|nr:T9SS type A sorting domain-containing protein [Chitinophagales bacterium]